MEIVAVKTQNEDKATETEDLGTTKWLYFEPENNSNGENSLGPVRAWQWDSSTRDWICPGEGSRLENRLSTYKLSKSPPDLQSTHQWTPMYTSLDCFSDLRFCEDFVNNFAREGTTAVKILACPFLSFWYTRHWINDRTSRKYLWVSLSQIPKEQEFLMRGTPHILGQAVLCGGGCAVHGRMLRSIPGLCSLDAGHTPPKFQQPKMTPDIDKSSPCEKHSFEHNFPPPFLSLYSF